MCNATHPHFLRQILLAAICLSAVLGAGDTLADPAEAEALMGAWCDDTGYRVELRADAITFLDAQAPNPPPGQELAFAAGMAVYSQDFRDTAWPNLDVVACTLRLISPDEAEETCTGPGFGFRPRIHLKRCPATPIS
jgi:hypothetical protein